MPTTTLPRRARLLAVPALAAAAALALPAGSARAAGDPHFWADASTVTLGPADAGDLKVAMQTMGPGDTLLLRPGTYAMGGITVFAHPGTPTHRITVAAADPAHPPLLQGLLRFAAPSWWTIDGIRVQATVRGEEAISFDGGDGWIVENSEFFGASRTGGYSNVTIGSKAAPAPRGFRFTNNCVHDAGRTYPADPNRRQMDHEMYVNFHGNAASGGMIDHNVIFNHPNGSGIKLGDGGDPRAVGPWGVRVTHNTIVEGGHQILLTGVVRNNLIDHNILATSRAPFTKSPKTTAIYVATLDSRSNVFTHNYVSRATMVTWDRGNWLVNRGDNGLRPDPGFRNVGRCGGWQTTNPQAADYGR